MIDKLSESMRKQMSATVDAEGYPVGPYPDYPIVHAEQAVEMLDAETHWIRSANLEFYYRYAVIENNETGERLVVNRWTKKGQWATVLKWLAEPDDYIEVVCKEME